MLSRILEVGPEASPELARLATSRVVWGPVAGLCDPSRGRVAAPRVVRGDPWRSGRPSPLRGRSSSRPPPRHGASRPAASTPSRRWWAAIQPCTVDTDGSNGSPSLPSAAASAASFAVSPCSSTAAITASLWSLETSGRAGVPSAPDPTARPRVELAGPVRVAGLERLRLVQGVDLTRRGRTGRSGGHVHDRRYTVEPGHRVTASARAPTNPKSPP